MLKVAVVGCGYWGPKLVRNFVSTISEDMAYVVDRDAARANSVCQGYPHLSAFDSVDALLGGADVDAVVIATPVHTHFDIARKAIERGKHVLIEKPMTHSVETSERLIELAERAGVTLMVDHTFVYTPAVRKMRELVSSGELGDLYYFDSVRINLGLFQHDINVLWDLAPHDIAIMDHVLQQTPIAVAAHGSAPISHSREPLESIAYLTVYYPDSLIAHIHVNWLAPVKLRKTLVGGSRKMVVYDDNEPDEKIKVYDKGVEIRPTDDPEKLYELLVSYRSGDMFAPKLDKTEALLLEAQHFVDCIRNGRKPITDGSAGLNVVRILEAAQRSMRADGERIPLDSAILAAAS